MSETEKIISGSGGYDYLLRCISIVTLLFEKGILEELIDSGRLDEKEIEERAGIILKKYPGFGGLVGQESSDVEEKG
ncbi:MAG TPA: hypothetical protein PLQ76_03055 [bacterium]|nr:hypothetical protein [bacterium]